VDVQTFHIDNGPIIQCQISFSIRAKRGRGVVQISEMGIKAPQQNVAKKYVVFACVTKLTNIGYNLPTLCSMMMRAINMSMRHDVEGLCASITRNIRNDVVKSKSNS
jgi:hypothetical protein